MRQSGMKKVKTQKGSARKKESESVMSEELQPTLRIHTFTGPKKNTSKSLRHNRPGQATTRLLLKQVHDGTEEELTVSPAGAVAASDAINPSSSPVAGIQQSQKKKIGVREKSRKMIKYVHEQRAARTLSIVVGAFILCWLPFFFFSPLAVSCKDCFANADQLFQIFTWMGYLNSMLNPLIYSRFSRDFRRAFKQILTCQRERKVKTAIKTPLSLVFTQLVSITQFWEQQGPSQSEIA